MAVDRDDLKKKTVKNRFSMPGIGIVKYEELQKIWASSMNGELNSEIPP